MNLFDIYLGISMMYVGIVAAMLNWRGPVWQVIPIRLAQAAVLIVDAFLIAEKAGLVVIPA